MAFSLADGLLARHAIVPPVRWEERLRNEPKDRLARESTWLSSQTKLVV